MNHNQIMVGILGAGRIGKVHLAAMRFNSGVSIKTLVDPFMTDELSKELLEMGVAHTSKEANDIFEDDEIQAVFICSPTDTHADFSMRALSKQKHVFCEKPVDLQLHRIREVQEVLVQNMNEGKNIVYQVGFNRRFDHNFLAVQNAINNDKIGKPQMIRITSRDPGLPPHEYIKVSGGIFLDMMIHDFDMMRFQTQSEIEEVYAIGSCLVDPTISELGDIDSAIVSCKCKNGMIGVIENCRQAVYGYDQRLEILGTNGAIKISNDTVSNTEISTKDGIYTETPLWFFLDRYKDAYQDEQTAFFESIAQNKPAVCGVVDGYESVRIAYAALKSLKEQRSVKIEEIT